ncbi:MAG: tyrosine phosphatase family protein [Pseudorhodoplanes sp.]|uniref:tyrosine phosphatase family protein n=1 Tax=Pseudorhodoplanes sp. TaxID=1934341 RepID=UPI003D0B60CB
MIHVCSLARLHPTVAETGARHVVTLIKDVAMVRRPPSIEEANHLLLDMDDIVTIMNGYVHPSEVHVEKLIDFVTSWDRGTPIVVHCYAGISRSTAGAFITACALNPKRDEASIARAIRSVSPSAQPNIRLVSLADDILGRGGRMTSAIRAIGPGIAAYEGHPFRLDLE